MNFIKLLCIISVFGTSLFANNISILNLNKQSILFSKNGTKLSKCYDEIQGSSDSHIYLAKQKDKYVYISDTGKELFNGKEFKNAYPFYNGLALVSDDGEQSYFIKENGTKNSNNIYYSDTPISSFNDGYAILRLKNLKSDTDVHTYAIIDKNEKIISYVFSSSFVSISDGMILANINGLFGYYDLNGKLKLLNEYEYATDFKDGMAIVKAYNEEYFKIINKYGKTVSKNLYLDLEREFSQGVISAKFLNPVTKMYQYGFIDKFENVVIQPRFDEPSEFGPNNIALINSKTKNYVQYIDKKGKVLFEDLKTKVKYFDGKKETEIEVPEVFEYGYLFDDNGFAKVISAKNKDTKYIDLTGRELQFKDYLDLKNKKICN